MDTEQFALDQAIDPGQLDVEAVRQAERFFFWAEKAAAARAEMDRLKFEADSTLAGLEIQIRKNPVKYGLEKVTESAITARAKMDELYRGAVEDHLHARVEYNFLEGAVSAMEQKKRMIEVLVTLHGQEYFAGPSVPHNLAETWLEHQRGLEEKTANKVKKASRRRVRREK